MRAPRLWSTRAAPRAVLARLCMALAGLAWLAGLAGLSFPMAARAQEAAALERRVKAAYLYKFADYVVWPDSAFARPDTPLTFGVLGDEQLAAELAQTIAGRNSAGRPLVLKRLRDGEPAAGVHILFVAGREGARLAQAVKSSGAQPLLIVTELEGGLDRGSAINFVVAGDRIKFEIALDAAEKRGLKLSSRLLTVALYVRPGAGSP